MIELADKAEVLKPLGFWTQSVQLSFGGEVLSPMVWRFNFREHILN